MSHPDQITKLMGTNVVMFRPRQSERMTLFDEVQARRLALKHIEHEMRECVEDYFLHRADEVMTTMAKLHFKNLAMTRRILRGRL